jgi:hypothetical protein
VSCAPLGGFSSALPDFLPEEEARKIKIDLKHVRERLLPSPGMLAKICGIFAVSQGGRWRQPRGARSNPSEGNAGNAGNRKSLPGETKNKQPMESCTLKSRERMVSRISRKDGVATTLVALWTVSPAVFM